MGMYSTSSGPSSTSQMNIGGIVNGLDIFFLLFCPIMYCLFLH